MSYLLNRNIVEKASYRVTLEGSIPDDVFCDVNVCSIISEIAGPILNLTPG